MIINVTQKHINSGKQFSGEYCPIALACKEALNSSKITVNYFGIKNNNKLIFKHSSNIIEEIISFDITGKMNEFSFQLN